MSGTENPPTLPGPTEVPGDTAGNTISASPPSTFVDDGTQDPPTAPGPVEVPGDLGGPALNPAT